MPRPRMGANAAKGFSGFKENYKEVVETGEKFIKAEVLSTWRMGKFARAKDECVFYIYRNFPEIYNRVFVKEPVLPEIPMKHYVLTSVFFIPEKFVNRWFWPQFGAQIINYMQYYMERLGAVLEELESTYEIIPPEEVDGDGE